MRRILPLVLLLFPASCATGTRYDLEAVQAFGSYAHDVSGTSNLDDRTSASFTRVRFEGFTPSGFGGGAALEGTRSDDDLLAGDGRYTGAGLFLYGGYCFEGDRFRLPLRMGPLFWTQELDVDDLALDEEWYAMGWALEGTPKFKLLSGKDSFELWAFGELRLAAMETAIDVDLGPLSENYNASAFLWSVRLGLEGKIRSFHFSLGYLGMGFSVDDSDWENGTQLRSTDDTFSGLAFSGGFRF